MNMAKPLFREKYRDDMPRAEAQELLNSGLRQLHYRDRATMNKFITATVTKDGVQLSEPFSVDAVWDHEVYRNPTTASYGNW